MKKYGKNALSLEAFFEVSDQLSEGAATFLRYKKEEEMQLYIKALWQKEVYPHGGFKTA